MKTVKCIMFAIVTCVTCALSATAIAAGEYRFHKTTQAEAVATWHEDDACAPTSITVTASNTIVTEGDGSPGVATKLAVTIWQYDECARRQLRDAYGMIQMTADQFSLGDPKKLDAATVSGNVTMHDSVTSEDYALDVTAVWNGDGELYRDEYRYKSKSPTLSVESSGKGQHRSARVSGTVVTRYGVSESVASGQLTYMRRSFTTK